MLTEIIIEEPVLLIPRHFSLMASITSSLVIAIGICSTYPHELMCISVSAFYFLIFEHKGAYTLRQKLYTLLVQN